MQPDTTRFLQVGALPAAALAMALAYWMLRPFVDVTRRVPQREMLID